MEWLRRVCAQRRWKRMSGAAILNEANLDVHRMTVWGQLPTGTWIVKRPLTIAASSPALYLTFRISSEGRLS